MRLLVTRPQPEAERTAQALRARGHAALAAALLRVEAVAADFGQGPFAAVLTTSANAPRAIARHPRLAELCRLPLLTVGRRSAEAARAVGFTDVTSAEGNARDLGALAARRFAGTGGVLIYLAGEDRAADLAQHLPGLSVRTVVTYRAVALEAFPPAAQAALAAGEIDGVLHFSRRSAMALVQCAERAGLLNLVLKLSHYCLSAEIAAPLAAAGAATIRIAARPEEVALIELI